MYKPMGENNEILVLLLVQPAWNVDPLRGQRETHSLIARGAGVNQKRTTRMYAVKNGVEEGKPKLEVFSF